MLDSTKAFQGLQVLAKVTKFFFQQTLSFIRWNSGNEYTYST